jgi:hypothetical protein
MTSSFEVTEFAGVGWRHYYNIKWQFQTLLSKLRHEFYMSIKIVLAVDTGREREKMGVPTAGQRIAMWIHIAIKRQAQCLDMPSTPCYHMIDPKSVMT